MTPSKKHLCGLLTIVLRGRSITAGNKGFAIAGVTCFVDTFVLNQSVMLRMNGSGNNARHRKPPKH